MTLELDIRQSGFGPIFVGAYPIGGPIDSPWEPEPGNSVTLRSGQIDVHAKITEASGRTYKGTITGFECNSELADDLGDGLEYSGAKVNDEIQFSYEHLVACSR